MQYYIYRDELWPHAVIEEAPEDKGIEIPDNLVNAYNQACENYFELRNEILALIER